MPPTPALRASGAAAGAASGIAVGVCTFLPLGVSVAVFLVLAAIVAFGWPRLVNLPSPRGTTAVLAVTSLALASVMITSAQGHRTRWAGAVLCLGLIGSFLHQLLRQDGRPRLVMSLAGTALGLGFLGAGSYLVPVHDIVAAKRDLVAVAAAVVVGAIAEALVGSTSRRIEFGVLQVVLGAGAGLVAGCIGGVGWLVAAATGALSGLLFWAALRTTVTSATSAHTRAQLAAGSAAALICCFVPFALAQTI